MKQRKINAVTRTVTVVIGALGISLGAHAATSFTPNNQPTGYIAPVALSTDWLMVDAILNPTPGGGRLYRPWFENGYWQGDLIEYSVLANGDFSTSIDLSTAPPGNTGSNWSARLRFDAAAPYDPASADATKHSPEYWTATRKIITTSLGAQVAFRWGNLTNSQKAALDSLSLTTDSYSEVLDYVRGQRDYESANPIDLALGAAAWGFRDRRNLLGDIQHSNPVFVAAPKAKYSGPGLDTYGTFKSTYATRAARVYVGANDGILHVFDATTDATKNGKEVYAYVPSMVHGNLNNLTRSPHTYFVDGPLSVGDAQVSSAWKTVLVGGLGAGGKGVFALDITNPDLTIETANTGDNLKVLWELNADSDNDLGYTYSRAVIARLNDSKWYAVMGNGYVSSSGIAKLYLIDIATGAVTKVSTASGSAGSPNGLSSPALVDTNGDFKVDYVYAGDIDGHLWKFDLSTGTPASWSGATPLMLYNAGTTQAITTAPDLVSYNGGYLIFFGTGRTLNSDDIANTDIQSIYAVLDKGAAVTSGELVTQVISTTTYTSGSTTADVRWATNNPIDWTTKKGWKINLPAGERLVTNPLVRAERLQLVTTTPSGTGQPTAWLVEPNYLTGGPPNAPVIDMNRDGKLTTADNVDGNGTNGLLDAVDRVMALKLGAATMSQPMFAVVDEVVGVGTMDTIFINQLELPIVETCTTDCLGGFYGGHIDVDSDSPFGPRSSIQYLGNPVQNDGLGNGVNGHQHEYDKAHGVVYVDVLGPSALNNATVGGVVTPATSRKGRFEPRRNLASLDAEKKNGTSVSQYNISAEEALDATATAPLISGSKEFIVVLANADLSSGGTITIGKKTWDVVVYQNMVYNKLKALGKIGTEDVSVTAATFTDDDGASLVFTLDGIKAGGGTLRTSFTNKAIIDGGLHPTSPLCVWATKNPYDESSVTVDKNLHITVVPNGASKDPSATTGYRWRNGSYTMQLLDASNFSIQPESWLPADKTGKIVGGIFAKKFSGAVYTSTVTKKGKKITTTSTTPLSFTEDEGTNDSGLLYEDILFWHFGDLYELRTGKTEPCYGNSNWQAAVTIESGGLTLGEYNKLLGGLTDDSAQIKAYAAALSDFNACHKSAACDADEAKLKALEMALYDAIVPIRDYVKFRGYAPGHIPDQHLLNIDKTLGSSTGSGSGSAPPGTVDTALGDYPTTTGPNYQRGRRTWTELTPRN